jgi:hypothetical protein
MKSGWINSFLSSEWNNKQVWLKPINIPSEEEGKW